MYLNGGMALTNGIIFFSDYYQVTAQTNPDTDEIEVEWEELPFYLSFFSLVDNIPFLRGALVPLEILLHLARVSLMFVLAAVLGIAVFIAVNHKVAGPGSSRYVDLAFAALVMFDMLRRVRRLGIKGFLNSLLNPIINLGRFHGAEHMAANAFWNNLKLNQENVRQSSRVSEYCGTRVAVAILLLALLNAVLFHIKPETSALSRILWGVFIPFAIGYEIANPRLPFISWPIIAISKLLQRYILTQKPTEEQIALAVVALEKLTEIEDSDQEPENPNPERNEEQ